jgi:hypothetical protein
MSKEFFDIRIKGALLELSFFGGGGGGGGGGFGFFSFFPYFEVPYKSREMAIRY